ncbi:MAG: lipopolysaccharide heptosyltransferase II [Candidatus Omnitrophica bacterium CG11_big_fil_rev_8_21_14_0_20_63_9]|nr:MAG: lipopolysaccharide heptosyltransferase II [Candidatus Omnitrophica bacterium CG11_big_fil_rev_8_21_14_0_20_63_9]
MSPGVQRILIIGPSNVGDAILASDVVASVRARYPHAHLTLVVGSRASAVFAGDPRVQALVDTGAFDSALGRLQLARSLWRYHPHLIVDLRHTLYPLLLKPLRAWRYFLWPPRRVAHMRDRHRWKLRAQLPQLTASGDAATAESPVWISPKDQAHVDGLCRRWQLAPERPLVVVCPGARSHLKRWMIEGFARVADRLIAEDGVEVVLSGEPEEKPIIEEIVALMARRPHLAVGLTTIRQLGALMQRARLVITNDSASLHVASAMRAPTLALFGPTDAAKYGPTAPRSRTLRRRLVCSPCEQPQCRFNHECMRFLSPEEVYDAARQLLEPAT